MVFSRSAGFVLEKLNDPRTTVLLVILNGISAGIGFFIGTRTKFPDAIGYWNIGRGIAYGTFSSWYFLPFDAPETLRTWGYPLFLFLCQQVSESFNFVFFVQFVIYATSVYLILRLIKVLDPALVYRNLFLILLLPTVKIAFFAGQISAEILCTFFVVLYVLVYYTLSPGWIRAVVLAVIAASMFHQRPAFLLFPFFIFAFKLVFDRRGLRYECIALLIYLALLIPFGAWNYRNHGVFRVTPLEGGAGVAHMGYWCFRLPPNYVENHYWGNICADELTSPGLVSDEERSEAAEAFELEWTQIETELAPLMDEEERFRLRAMKENNPGQFLTYSGEYTSRREQLLWQRTLGHIQRDPWFYVKTRMFTFLRIWYTGISRENWQRESGSIGRLTAIYPFVSTFVLILGGLLVSFYGLVSGRLDWRRFYVLYLMVGYCGLVHVLFVYQSRYTVPVHFLVLCLTSFTIGSFLPIGSKDRQEVHMTEIETDPTRA